MDKMRNIDKTLKRQIEEFVKKQIENKTDNIRFRYGNTAKYFLIEFNKFLKNIPQTDKDKFIGLVKTINRLELLKRFERAIINYNIQEEIKKLRKSEGLRFLLICISIESYFNYHTENEEGNTATFIKFFRKISQKSKDLICKKFKIEINKSFSDSELLEKFPSYLYEKRGFFVHEGVHFTLNDENSLGLLDSFKKKDLPINLKMTLPDFKEVFLDGLYENLKSDIEELKLRKY